MYAKYYVGKSNKECFDKWKHPMRLFDSFFSPSYPALQGWKFITSEFMINYREMVGTNFNETDVSPIDYT